MHDLYSLKDKLIKELEEYGRKDLSESSLKIVDTLAHAAKNIGKVIECCEDEEYSNRGYSRRRGMSYGDGASYDYVRPDGSYRDGGASYRGRGAGAKRDSMGRYSRSDMSEELRMLMDKAPDEHTKEELRRIMDRL